MRGLLTTVLDVLGAALIVLAGAFLAAELEFSPLVRWLAVAGLGFLFVSWLADGAPLPGRKGN
jgi:hypothetical protein